MANYSSAGSKKAKKVWEQRDLGIDISALDLKKPASASEVAYLLSQFPYLQIISSKPNWTEGTKTQFKQIGSGWVVHDYGEAMSTSLGARLFIASTPKNFPSSVTTTREEEEGTTGGETTSSGGGTLVKQAVDTVYAMIQLAVEKGWPGMEIISGTELMQWAAWMAAQDFNLLIVGYNATKQQQEKRDRIVKLRSLNKLSPSTPTPSS